MLYMLPHGPFMNGTPTRKSDAGGGGGWSTWNGSYWCCTGAGAESFAWLGETIYFHCTKPTIMTNATVGQEPTIYVNQLVSSTLNLHNGLQLEQQVDIGLPPPSGRTDTVAIARQSIRLVSIRSSQPVAHGSQKILLRIPGWTDGRRGGALVILNSSRPEAQTNVTPPSGSYLPLWLTPQGAADHSSAVIADFEMRVRLKRVTEYRTSCVAGFSTIGGFCPQQFYSIHVVRRNRSCMIVLIASLQFEFCPFSRDVKQQN